MSNWKERWENWKADLQHTYRLVVMNDETFEERGSYRLTMMNVYVLISTVLVVVAFIVFGLLAVTPLKRYIPGYGQGSNNKQALELARTVDSLEQTLALQQQYTENVRRMLVGDVETQEDVEMEDIPADTTEYDPDITNESVDRELRKEVQLERIGIAMRQGDVSTGLTASRTRLEQLYFVSPITGEISAHFAPDTKHLGVDILAPKNSAIKAALDGYVFISDWTLETGNTIGIQHANNIITFYKHNSALLKKAGTFVRAGEAIAIIGNTGTLTDGPHLHFEMWYNGTPVNPVDYISF